MKIAVIGPGAMGCLVAAICARGNHDVLLFDKNEERASFLNKNGILIEEEKETHHICMPILTINQKTLPDDFDLIIIAVKAYHTASTIETIKKISSTKTAIMTIQNGIGNLETLLKAIPEARLFAAITSLGATLLDTGKIKRCSHGSTTISPFSKTDIQFARELAKTLSESGLYAKASDNLQGTLWSKLIINAAICPASALSNLPNGELLKSSEWCPKMMQASEEGEHVAKALSINLLYPSAKEAVRKVCEETSTNFSSMLQDILRKRQTEIEYINGAILKAANANGIHLPVNSFFYERIKSISQ